MLIDFPLFCLAGINGISLVGDSLKTVAVTSMLMTRCLGQSNYEEAVRGCANQKYGESFTACRDLPFRTCHILMFSDLSLRMNRLFPVYRQFFPPHVCGLREFHSRRPRTILLSLPEPQGSGWRTFDDREVWIPVPHFHR